jgi:peptidoglycan/xylan/chitin deacetylase (PgdA/CDA1 family)
MSNQYVINRPVFVISLDFELMWGVFDKRSIQDYGDNIRGVHDVIPQILKLFKEFGIHCTWAVVGGLYYETLEELKADLPDVLPTYKNDAFSAYSHLKKVKAKNFRVYYSGLKLIKLIKSAEGQEVGTHTFSHYYCLEEGQNEVQFRKDIQKAVTRAAVYGIKVRSIIFPRNQYNVEYLKICKQEGITSFRGNESNFIQKPRTQEKLSIYIRILRLADTYLNLTGSNIYNKFIEVGGLINIPASFFFRPVSHTFSWLEKIKIQRYKRAMLAAAQSNSAFHLWWHPHNFGKNPNENLKQLKELLVYYTVLNKKYGMRSLNMGEITKELINS